MKIAIANAVFSDQQMMAELHATNCIYNDDLKSLKEFCTGHKVDLTFEYLRKNYPISARVGTALVIASNMGRLEILAWLLESEIWSELQLRDAIILATQSEKLILDTLNRRFPDFLKIDSINIYIDSIIKAKHWQSATKVIAICEEENNNSQSEKYYNTNQKHVTMIANQAIFDRQWNVAQIGVDTKIFKQWSGGLLTTAPDRQWGGSVDHHDKIKTFSNKHLVEFLNFLKKNKKHRRPFPMFETAARRSLYVCTKKFLESGIFFDLQRSSSKILDIICEKKDEKMFQLLCMNKATVQHFEYDITCKVTKDTNINTIFVVDRFFNQFYGCITSVPEIEQALIEGGHDTQKNLGKLSSTILYAHICLWRGGYFIEDKPKQITKYPNHPEIKRHQNAIKFLKITSQLSMEVQMMICNTAYNHPTKIFPVHEITECVRYLTRKYENDQSLCDVSRYGLLCKLGAITDKQYNNFFC